MIGKRTKLPLRTLLVCGGLGLALLAGAGVTAARYVMQNRQSGVMTAEEFYFTSDLLREPSETALYYIDPKAETFSFHLFNYCLLYTSLKIRDVRMNVRVCFQSPGIRRFA